MTFSVEVMSIYYKGAEAAVLFTHLTSGPRYILGQSVSDVAAALEAPWGVTLISLRVL